MARLRNPTSDRDQFVSPNPLSEFMTDDVVQSPLDRETIEYITKRAGYISYFSKPQDEERLEYLINARWSLGAVNISEWNEILSDEASRLFRRRFRLSHATISRLSMAA